MNQEITLALISLVGGIVGGLAVNITIEGVRKQRNKNRNYNKQASKGDYSPNTNTNGFDSKQ